LPKDVRVQDVRVPLDGKRDGIFDRDLLGGMAVIDAEVVAQPSGNWDEKLYRPAQRRAEKSFRTRFIPYYAWGNRGKSEMSVWLPAK
jgi:uncharacterized protein